MPLARAWERRSLAGLVALLGAVRINCFRFGVFNPQWVDPLDREVANCLGAGPAHRDPLERRPLNAERKANWEGASQFNCYPHDASSNSQLRDSKCQSQCNREKRNPSSRRAINLQIIQMTITAFIGTCPALRTQAILDEDSGL